MEQEKEITRELNPNFFKLWDLKCVQNWRDEEKHLKIGIRLRYTPKQPKI